MITFTIITTILAVLFVLLLARTFSKTSLKSLFNNAKNASKINLEREKAVNNGEIPFYFRRGTVVIYAKTQGRAIHKYNIFKANEKKQRNGVRK